MLDEGRFDLNIFFHGRSDTQYEALTFLSASNVRIVAISSTVWPWKEISFASEKVTNHSNHLDVKPLESEMMI